MTSPVTTLPERQRPDFWNIWGHSYVQVAYGTLHATGRMDSLFCAAMDIEYNNRRNYAKDGAALIRSVRSQGGYNRVQQDMTPDRTIGPYVSDTGAHLMVWGINDIGVVGQTAQHRDAWKQNLRGVISRCRASAVFEDTHASISYAAGFTLNTPSTDFASGTSTRHATSLTNANFTITIPADYKGEVIALSFVGQSGAFGGTITFSGTAGMTGTLSVSSQSAPGYNGMVIRRYVAPVTGATQTIICTLTQLDAGGDVHFDCWWLEAIAPPPILVCNIAKLTATGYGLYSGTWSGTEAAKDGQVNDWNADLASVVAEFDSMVQIVDIDSALNKDADLFYDGLHPNELGAAKCANACLTAMKRLIPTTTYGDVAHLNPSSERGAQVRRTRIRGLWYTSDTRGFGSNYTAVAQHMFFIPFIVTSARERYTRMQIEAIASVTGTTVRWGIYNDRKEYGYPQDLHVELTATTGPFTITTGAGAKPCPAVPTAGSLNTSLDPGLWWLAIKFCVVGTTHTFRTVAGQSLNMPNCTTTGLGSIAPSGWRLASQGTGAFPQTAVGSPFATAILSDNCPAIFMQLF